MQYFGYEFVNMNSLEIYLQLKLNKEESSATDLLGIFLGAKVDIGAAEGLGSPSK